MFSRNLLKTPHEIPRDVDFTGDGCLFFDLRPLAM